VNSVCILVYSWIKANYHQFEDWYSIHKADVLKKGGRMLFDAYPSLPAALKAAFPEFPWDPARFARHKSHSAQQLRELDHQREIFNGVSHKVGISKVRFQFDILEFVNGKEQMEDWYGVSRAEVLKAGGGSVLTQYPSLADVLQTIYPHHTWERKRFRSRNPRGFWKNIGSQREVVERVGKTWFNIKQVREYFQLF